MNKSSASTVSGHQQAYQGMFRLVISCVKILFLLDCFSDPDI